MWGLTPCCVNGPLLSILLPLTTYPWGQSARCLPLKDAYILDQTQLKPCPASNRRTSWFNHILSLSHSRISAVYSPTPPCGCGGLQLLANSPVGRWPLATFVEFSISRLHPISINPGLLQSRHGTWLFLDNPWLMITPPQSSLGPFNSPELDPAMTPPYWVETYCSRIFPGTFSEISSYFPLRFNVKIQQPTCPWSALYLFCVRL